LHNNQKLEACEQKKLINNLLAFLESSWNSYFARREFALDSLEKGPEIPVPSKEIDWEQ
jgi:hypothetical protein